MKSCDSMGDFPFPFAECGRLQEFPHLSRDPVTSRTTTLGAQYANCRRRILVTSHEHRRADECSLQILRFLVDIAVDARSSRINVERPVENRP